MIDPTVERHYADCKELLDLWSTFHDYYVMGVKGENITPEAESQFLDIKSRIAMLHDSFIDALTHDQNIGQGMLKIVESAITLKHLNRQSPAETKKMEIEWHEAYLLLNQTIGALEDRRNELANMSAAQVRAQKAAGATAQNVRKFLTSGYFKIGVGAAAALFLTVGVQFLGIFDWNTVANMPALHAPYRMFKAIYRSVIDAESPWPNIAVMSRKPFATAGMVYEPPEIRNDPPDQFISTVPDPKIKELLGKKLEYVKEMIKTKAREGQGSKTAYIHSFRMPDVKTAREIRDAWVAYRDKNPEITRRLQFVQDSTTVNIVVFIESDQSDVINDLWVKVYGQS
ncbi:MAG: hypothetical protein N2111_07795 [Candidatus Sumerlaeaceae bacterium]|nr:hypothetical protein [Candidatus Sumerlaeaceae bacterium]